MNATRRTVLFFALFGLLTIRAGTQPRANEFLRFPSTGLLSRDIVLAHNTVRNKIGVPALAWSDDLAQVAQNWADTLLVSGSFAHRRNSLYGENLYEITGGISSPSEVVSAWASEMGNYQYTTNSCSGICGHYTQLVWRDTKSVGCGTARDAKREIWVCNYAPFGNIIGEKPY